MTQDLSAEQAQAAARLLRATTTVRARCRQLLSRARQGESAWFIVDEGFFESAAREVVGVTRARYPGLQIPFHSRWRHFEAGGVDRKGLLEDLLAGHPVTSRAHAMIDLTVVSVLLDAGAGADWRYTEAASGQTFTRSEGLGVASFHAFCAGLFSNDPHRPLQVDANGLRRLQPEALAAAFQAGPGNPLVGLDGRTRLLRRLGEALAEQPEVFGAEGRPGGLFDLLAAPAGAAVAPTTSVAAHDILTLLLRTLSAIWPAGQSVQGVPLGDCWRHAAVRGEGLSDGWVPFHKLSQWLTYSLLEPFAWAGVQVRGLDALTALPEYRNGGLLLDAGLLRLRDESVTQQVWTPGDELIVEWRALTVALLDDLAREVRRQLDLTEAQMPLACMLEGGTWAAGRALAQRLRGGLPPLQVASDGTVF